MQSGTQLSCEKVEVSAELPTVTADVDNPMLIPYILTATYLSLSGRNSVVECQLPKLDVAGSTPVARSKFNLTIESAFVFAR
jgi:hypothetical protein